MTVSVTGIRVQTEQPVLEIRIPCSDVRIDIDDGDYSLDITYPEVQLDAKECWDDIGYKTIYSFNRSVTEKCNEKALEGIRRMAIEGDRLASDLLPEGKALIDIIKERWFEEKVFNVAAVPEERVKVHVFHGEVSGRYRPYNMDVAVPKSVVEIKYTRGKVKIEYTGNDYGRY